MELILDSVRLLDRKDGEGKTGSVAFISSSLGFKTISQPPQRFIFCDYSDGSRHWRDARRKKGRQTEESYVLYMRQ